MNQEAKDVFKKLLHRSYNHYKNSSDRWHTNELKEYQFSFYGEKGSLDWHVKLEQTLTEELQTLIDEPLFVTYADTPSKRTDYLIVVKTKKGLTCFLLSEFKDNVFFCTKGEMDENFKHSYVGPTLATGQRNERYEELSFLDPLIEKMKSLLGNHPTYRLYDVTGTLKFDDRYL